MIIFSRLSTGAVFNSTHIFYPIYDLYHISSPVSGYPLFYVFALCRHTVSYIVDTPQVKQSYYAAAATDMHARERRLAIAEYIIINNIINIYSVRNTVR